MSDGDDTEGLQPEAIAGAAEAAQPVQPIAADPEDLADLSFDWSPWGRDNWKAWGEAAKCTRVQIRYAALRWRGVTETEAARRALLRIPETVKAFQQAAYRLEVSKGVNRLLDSVNDQMGRGVGPMGREEMRQRLTNLIRGGGDPLMIKGCEALLKMDADDRERAREARESGTDAAFLAAAQAAPIFGAVCLSEMYLTRHGSLPFSSDQFRRLAPMIATVHETVWAGWRARLRGHEETMDALAAGELPAEFYDEDPPSLPEHDETSPAVKVMDEVTADA
jgi:hypothetical protein